MGGSLCRSMSGSSNGLPLSGKGVRICWKVGGVERGIVKLIEMGRPRHSVIWVHHIYIKCEPATKTNKRHKQINVQPCRTQKQQYKNKIPQTTGGKRLPKYAPQSRDNDRQLPLIGNHTRPT